MKKLLICLAAGGFGALANSFAVWACGKYGISSYFGVHIAPALTPPWLYQRIVWGGIWGLLFILPLLNPKPIAKGILLSIFPTLVQLLVVFPLQAKKGYLGLELGAFTPLFVVLFNIVWGIVTSLFIRWAR
jgi:hypothetical protein